MALWIIAGIIAGLVLAIISNCLYDIGKEKGWFPNNPSIKYFLFIITLCLPLVLVVSIPSIFNLQETPTPVIPGVGVINSSNNVSADASIIIQGDDNIINPPELPSSTTTVTPGPIVTPLAFATSVPNETLILIATFHNTAAINVEAHTKIQHSIEAEAAKYDEQNLRVAVEPTELAAN